MASSSVAVLNPPIAWYRLLVACRGANITRLRIWSPEAVLAQSTAFEHQQRRCAASAVTNSLRQATRRQRLITLAQKNGQAVDKLKFTTRD